jgi:hypothetical protein
MAVVVSLLMSRTWNFAMELLALLLIQEFRSFNFGPVYSCCVLCPGIGAGVVGQLSEDNFFRILSSSEATKYLCLSGLCYWQHKYLNGTL